jgi:hypothetical protein
MTTPRMIEGCTIADSLVKSATIQSSEVGVIGMLGGAASAGISVLVGIGVASDSTNGASDGRVACVGRIVLIVVILTGRGDRARGWMAGVICSFWETNGINIRHGEVIRLLGDGKKYNRGNLATRPEQR